MSDIGEGVANAYNFWTNAANLGAWLIYQEDEVVKIDYRNTSGSSFDSSSNLSAFYYLAAGVPTVNPPTIKLIESDTTRNVTFTLAELMTHWNGSLEYCQSQNGTDGGSAGVIPQSIPIVALLATDFGTDTQGNTGGGIRDNGGQRTVWQRSTLTLGIGLADTQVGFKYVILRG